MKDQQGIEININFFNFLLNESFFNLLQEHLSIWREVMNRFPERNSKFDAS